MTISFKQLAVAAVAAASFASVQAAATPFLAPVTDSFSLSTNMVDLLTKAKAVLTAQGTATFANNVLTLPATSTSLSTPAATDLMSFAQGAGLKITIGADVLTLGELTYNAATNSINGIVSLNGTQQFSGTALQAKAAGTTSENFVATAGTGLQTSSDMFMTDGAATSLVTALGFPSYLSGAVTGVSFGTFKVDVTGTIPEPSTYALMGLGLVGIALAARKRKAA